MDAQSSGGVFSAARHTFVLVFALALISCGDSATGPAPQPEPQPAPQPEPEEPGPLRGQVAYAAFEAGNGTWSLVTRSLEGGEAVELALDPGDEDGLPDRAVFQLRWSPDGESLLYRSTKTFTDDWYFVLVDADGSNRRLITPHTGFAIDPEFSPAGDRILYKRGGLTPLGLGIPTQTSIVNLAGVSTDVFVEEAVLIEGRPVYFDQNDDPVEALYDAQWGRDGEHLYVVGFFDAPPTAVPPAIEKVEVFEVSLATGRAVRRVTRNALDETRFHSSPDGTRLIVRRGEGSGLEAVLLTVDRPAEMPVIASGFDMLPRWATDGRHVSYVATDGIWLVDLDGDGLRVRLAEGSAGSTSNSWPEVFVRR